MIGAAINVCCAFVNLAIWANTGSTVALGFAAFSMGVAIIFAIADAS